MVERIVKHNCYSSWFGKSLKSPKKNGETAVQDVALRKGSTQSWGITEDAKSFSVLVTAFKKQMS